MYLVKQLSKQEGIPLMGKPNVLNFRKPLGSNVNIGIIERVRPPQGQGPQGQHMLMVGGGERPVITPGTPYGNRNAARHRLAEAADTASPTGESPWLRTIRQHADSNLNPNVTKRQIFSLHEQAKESTATRRRDKYLKLQALKIQKAWLSNRLRKQKIALNAVKNRKHLKTASAEFKEFQRHNRHGDTPPVNFAPIRQNRKRKTYEEISDSLSILVNNSRDFRNQLDR